MTEAYLPLREELDKLLPKPAINWSPSPEEVTAVVTRLQKPLQAIRDGNVALTYEVELADHFEDDTNLGAKSTWIRLTNWIDEHASYKHIEHDQNIFDAVLIVRHFDQPDLAATVPDELRPFFADARAMGCRCLSFYIG